MERKDLKLYIAFRRLKNFASVVGHTDHLHLFLHLDPSKVNLVDGFMRDVTSIGHWGTGNLRLRIGSLADLERAKPFIARSYNPVDLEFRES